MLWKSTVDCGAQDAPLGTGWRVGMLKQGAGSRVRPYLCSHYVFIYAHTRETDAY